MFLKEQLLGNYRYYINYENPTVDDYIRGFNNLGAYYLPGKEKHETIAPVNVFRIVFNSYLEMNYEILDDRQIWHSPKKPFYQNDVRELIIKFEKGFQLWYTQHSLSLKLLKYLSTKKEHLECTRMFSETYFFARVCSDQSRD